MQSLLLVGKPNSGKSLLFNRLTGLRQKVANFPGVTVEVTSASFGDAKLVDFPGIYSLNPLTRDENISVEKFFVALRDPELAGVVCVLDATRLERSLVIGIQAQQAAQQKGKAFVFALNMIDELRRHRLQVDVDGLSAALGVPVFAVSAKTGVGLDRLREQLALMSASSAAAGEAINNEKSSPGAIHQRARELAKSFGPKIDVLLKTQSRFDRFLLGGFTGGLVFFATMTFMFQAIFTWATPMMDAIEAIINVAGVSVSSLIPNQILADFVADAIFGGFGSFLVFVPQIFMLTFIIGILEDTGYLARAAVICHRPLSLFGLSGKSFVPLLSGHACAIPAIFAARTIESPKHRLLTIIAIPLMSCSARLPVYGLLVSVLVPPMTMFAGTLGLQGIVFFALYVFGIVTALLVTAFASPVVKESSAPFVIELPPYRWPNWKPLLQRSVHGAWSFVAKAGLVIFVVTVVVWVLGYFPNGAGHLDSSWLASLGQWIEPIMRPLGLDWKFGVAVIASFVAREVFVGTLGTMYGIDGGEDRIADVAGQISAVSPAAIVALLVFYVIALQCASTLAVIRKELGSWKIPVLLFLGYGLAAYILALLSYQVMLLIA